MRHNLTAVFNNQGDAQHVLDELLASGYPGPRTTLVSPRANAATGDASVLGTVKRAFARLSGSPHYEPEGMDEPSFLPGRHVINLSAATGPDSVRAIGILERFGPVYIEDRHEHGERTPVDAEPASAAGQIQSARRSQVGYPAGCGPGALQGRLHSDDHLFGTQGASDPFPRGNTYQEVMGSSLHWDEGEDVRGLHSPAQSVGGDSLPTQDLRHLD